MYKEGNVFPSIYMGEVGSSPMLGVKESVRLLPCRHTTGQEGVMEKNDASPKMPAYSQFKNLDTKQYVWTQHSSATKTHTHVNARAQKAIRKKHAPNGQTAFLQENDLFVCLFFCVSIGRCQDWRGWGEHGREDTHILSEALFVIDFPDYYNSPYQPS